MGRNCKLAPKLDRRMEAKWQRPSFFAREYGLSAYMLDRLAGRGLVRRVKVAPDKRSAVIFAVADVDKWLASEARCAGGGISRTLEDRGDAEKPADRHLAAETPRREGW